MNSCFVGLCGFAAPCLPTPRACSGGVSTVECDVEGQWGDCGPQQQCCRSTPPPIESTLTQAGAAASHAADLTSFLGGKDYALFEEAFALDRQCCHRYRGRQTRHITFGTHFISLPYSLCQTRCCPHCPWCHPLQWPQLLLLPLLICHRVAKIIYIGNHDRLCGDVLLLILFYLKPHTEKQCI